MDRFSPSSLLKSKKKKKKEKVVPITYQIVSQTGLEHGSVVEGGDTLQRSWTVRNAAPLNSPEKGKVVKLVHDHGTELCSHILFLWPVPGKNITFTVTAIAPNYPGTYESHWRLEGASKAEFSMKFQVRGPDGAEDRSDPSTESTENQTIPSPDRSPKRKSKKNGNKRKKQRHSLHTPAFPSAQRRTSKLSQEVVSFQSSHPPGPSSPTKSQEKASRTPSKDDHALPRHLKEEDNREGRKRALSYDVGRPSLPETSEEGEDERDGTKSPVAALIMASSPSSAIARTVSFEDSEFSEASETPVATAAVALQEEESSTTTAEEEPSSDTLLPQDVQSTPIQDSPPPQPKKAKFVEPVDEPEKMKKEKRKREEEEEQEKERNMGQSASTDGIDLPVPEQPLPDEVIRELDHHGKLSRNRKTKSLQFRSTSQLHKIIHDSPSPHRDHDDDLSSPKGKVSLVDRWQQSVISKASEELTAQQKERKRLMRDLNVSMKDVRKRMKKPEPTETSTTVDESAVRELILVPARRLDEFISPHSNVAAFIEAGRTLQNYFELGEYVASQLQHLRSTSPVDSALSRSLQVMVDSIQRNIPIIQSTQQQLDLVRHTREEKSTTPDWAWLHIFSFLSCQDLLAVSRTCKKWNQLAQDDSLWKSIYEDRLQAQVLRSGFLNEHSYKHLFKIEKCYTHWFANECVWEKETCKAMTDVSCNWPVYDLEIVGESLVTVSDCLRVFDLKRDKPKGILGGHNKLVTTVRMMDHGKACVTGSVDCTVKLWSLQHQDCLQTFEGHGGPIRDVHHTQNLVLSSSLHDKTVRGWDKVSGQCAFTLPFDSGVSALGVNLTDHSQRIYMGHSDGTVSLWDIEQQQRIHSVRITEERIESLQVIGRHVIASDGSQIFIQDLYARDNSPICVSEPMVKGVGRLAYDGYRLGAQVGKGLHVFDVRQLFDCYSRTSVDNLWKGAFQFHGDYILVGGGDGKTYKYYPTANN